jgi:hypothetical protein
MEKALKSLFDEVTQMWHPDTPENRRILASESWKVQTALWGPPIRPLPDRLFVMHIPATCPRDEGSAQSGPDNPYAKRFQGRKETVFGCT